MQQKRLDILNFMVFLGKLKQGVPTSFKSMPASNDTDSLPAATSTSHTEDAQLAYIVGKRETRQTTLYQVQLLN